MATWQAQTAKAKFSELLRAASETPQRISVHGKVRYVISTVEEFEKSADSGTLLDLFQPILGLGVELKPPERKIDRDRPVPFADDA